MAVMHNNGMEGQLADALSTIQDVFGNLRRLQAGEICTQDKVDLQDAHNIAQIIQGAGFIFLAMWLIFANNSKVAVAQKAPLEQRHAVCATISTAVALFSGFFNILQLTAIDDFELPGRENNFSLNLSRPIEWIATCPIMQLKLVVLAGARVPSYRRFMMPLLSVAVLLCGTASMFTGDALRFGWYGFGLCLACIMFWHNIIQIKENSEGEENAFNGDSDFRKLSLLLILTWFPFPIWFSLSIEGFGVITDYLVIEMGWVALNIVSKFTFIIWMQRMKMVHQRKLEAARELYGLSPTDEIGEDELKQKTGSVQGKAAAGGVNANDYGLGYGEEADSEQKMVEVVAETMVTLGMSAHTDRFLKLMVENGVTNTAVLERLNGERCMELNLPYVLVEACQKRWSSEKMNLGQDQGGVVLKEDPFKKLLEANKERMTAKPGLLGALPGMTGDGTPPIHGNFQMMMGLNESMEDQLRNVMQEVLMPFREEVMTKLHTMEENTQRQLEASQEAMAQRMDFSQVAILQTVNACQVLLHKLDSSQDSVVQKVDTQKLAVDNLLNSITGATDNTKQVLMETVNSSSSVLLQKLDITQQDLLKQTKESHAVLEGVATKQTALSKQVDSGNEFTRKRLVEMESTLERRVTETSEEAKKDHSDKTEMLLANMKSELAVLAAQCAAMAETTEKATATQEERMVDVRRQTMLIMDLVSSTQDAIQQSSESLQSFTRSEYLQNSAANLEMSMREVVMKQLLDVKNSLLGVEGGQETNLKDAVVSMVQRLDEGVRRMELASEVSGSGPSETDLLRQELSSMAESLSKQQQEVSKESLAQVSEVLQTELSAFKETQKAETAQISESLTGKVSEFSEQVNQNLARFEANLEKVLDGKGGGREPEGRRTRADRG
ncbi:Histidine--tRNA ligase (Fragment) [Durusdinium trenchii]|uniref:Histidine--tRNA ligase n=1 Tax=Durusdinium trenchii TaxID=1381693 RepID=A0ABP0S9F9_9DINO